jgi:hypothetical protein
MAETHALAGIVVSAGGDLGPDVCTDLRARSHSFAMDLWVPELAKMARAHREAGDMLLDGGSTAEASTVSTTALRYLPDALRHWTDAERTSEPLIVLCDPDDMDLYGVDILKSHFSRRAVAKTPSDIISFTDEFVETLAGRRPPALLVAVGRDQHAVETCRCIAAYADIAFIHLSTAEMPVNVILPDGRIELCTGFGDVARLLPELAAARHVWASEHLKDTGWSTYWRHLSRA